MNRFALLTACAVAVFVMGCKSYPDKIRTVKTQLALGPDNDVPVVYRAEEAGGKNALLVFEEQGRLDQLQGRYRESADAYQKAMSFCEMQADGAVVRVGETLKASLAATYGNDLAMDYPVLAFDQMMLRSLDFFNRLALGEWDNAGVDIRNLTSWRNQANEIIMRDTDALRNALGEKKRNELESRSAYTTLMKKESMFISGLRRSTDNVFALYLIALYHEIEGDSSNALMAYGDIENIKKGLPGVKEGVDRVNGVAIPPDCGEVVVFFEEGYIPQKRKYRFEDGGLFTTVVSEMPFYSAYDCLPYEEGGPMIISVDGRNVASTAVYCDFAPLAVKSHEERLRGIIARQISRTSIKAITRGIFSGMALAGAYCAANGIGDDRGYTQTALLTVGIVGSIGMGIMASATEQADLRSWLLLPRQVQLARFPAKAGRHDLTLRTAEGVKKLSAEVRPGAMTIVHCSSVPGVLDAFSVCIDKKRKE